MFGLTALYGLDGKMTARACDLQGVAGNLTGVLDYIMDIWIRVAVSVQSG